MEDARGASEYDEDEWAQDNKTLKLAMGDWIPTFIFFNDEYIRLELDL